MPKLWDLDAANCQLTNWGMRRVTALASRDIVIEKGSQYSFKWVVLGFRFPMIDGRVTHKRAGELCSYPQFSFIRFPPGGKRINEN